MLHSVWSLLHPPNQTPKTKLLSFLQYFVPPSEVCGLLKRNRVGGRLACGHTSTPLIHTNDDHDDDNDVVDDYDDEDDHVQRKAFLNRLAQLRLFPREQISSNIFSYYTIVPQGEG